MNTAMLRLTMWASFALVGAACQHQDQCNCGTGGGSTIFLMCDLAAGTVAQTTGPCTATQAGPRTISVAGSGEGTCHVSAALASGATASTDITFTSKWLPCGSDAHGCGQVLVAAPAEVDLGDQCGDSGLDSGLTE